MPLASYACHPEQSRGRLYREPAQDMRGPRDIFQRDRDRIIHSIAFRRLRHKTQVFISPDGDHYRVRLTHSLEVAQIGRTIARALGLNEDLTEALCLAHDIGHPPFGHAGEDALEAALKPHGGFDHNAQTLRTLTRLECPYPAWPGLNLSWELLEGLAKHNGPVDHPTWALAEVNDAFDLDLRRWPSLEAQIAAVADDIAYDNHDIDDGIRAGLLTVEQLFELPFIEDRWLTIERRYPDARRETLVRELVREQIGVMVNDVIDTTRRRITESGTATADDIRALGNAIGGFSPELADRERNLKRFMYNNLYHHREQVKAADQAKDIIADLYRAYSADRDLLPDDWRTSAPEQEPQRSRHIADFLAGMTDRYATNRHREIFWEGRMTRIILAGATGLVGSHLVPTLVKGGHELHIIGRRAIPDLDDGIKQHVEDTSGWPSVVRQLGAEIAISCLGTTMKQAGSKNAFRAVDFDLIVAFAGAAKEAGAGQFIAVSSVGASAHSSNFYLKTKGETEQAVGALGFDRIDFLRPGLLRGDRAGPSRPGESIAAMLSPVTDMLMIGGLDRYRSISARTVAKAIAQLAGQSASGRFIHENREIETLAG